MKVLKEAVKEVNPKKGATKLQKYGPLGALAGGAMVGIGNYYGYAPDSPLVQLGTVAIAMGLGYLYKYWGLGS